MELFFAVRRRVADITRREQIPWTQDGLMRQVHFGSLEVSPPPPPDREAAEGWDRTKDSTPITPTPTSRFCYINTNRGDCETWPGCEWIRAHCDSKQPGENHPLVLTPAQSKADHCESVTSQQDCIMLPKCEWSPDYVYTQGGIKVVTHCRIR